MNLELECALCGALLPAYRLHADEPGYLLWVLTDAAERFGDGCRPVCECEGRKVAP